MDIIYKVFVLGFMFFSAVEINLQMIWKFKEEKKKKVSSLE